MFSPIFCTSATRRASTVSPEASLLAPSAATSAGLSRAAICAIFCANALKSSLRATKSVSQLTSTIAPVFASGRDPEPDHAFGGDAAGGLGRLRAAT